MAKDDHEQVWKDFRKAVNMAPARLEKWLGTDESREVGWKGSDGDDGGESVGHRSGRRIIAIKRKKKADLTADDYAHMKKVAAFVARHMKQGGPARDKRHSPWRYSLMNWGHDPLKA